MKNLYKMLICSLLLIPMISACSSDDKKAELEIDGVLINIGTDTLGNVKEKGLHVDTCKENGVYFNGEKQAAFICPIKSKDGTGNIYIAVAPKEGSVGDANQRTQDGTIYALDIQGDALKHVTLSGKSIDKETLKEDYDANEQKDEFTFEKDHRLYTVNIKDSHITYIKVEIDNKKDET